MKSQLDFSNWNKKNTTYKDNAIINVYKYMCL